jgi:hypothetical protein
MTSKEYIDKEVVVYHRKWVNDKQVVTDQVMLKKAKVISANDSSRTLVTVEDTDRGEGWDEEKKKYVGVRVNFGGYKNGKYVGSGWYRGENYFYGKQVENVHTSQLKLIEIKDYE